MRHRLPASLRWRLLLALVATAMITLGATAWVLVGPLQERLRAQAADQLETDVIAFQQRFETALGHKDAGERASTLGTAIFQLTLQTDARVLVGNASLTSPGNAPPSFTDDSESLAPVERATVLVAVEAMNHGGTQRDLRGDTLNVAAPLYGKRGKLVGVLVAERRLNEVTAVVDRVRNGLLAAGGFGLLVAIVLATALSSTLLRRLGRLRTIALRISREGPDVPTPHDSHRDEVGDLARTLALMQEELRRQEAARRAFVSTASHELRTPLTMLQGTMELLEEDLGDGRLDLDDAQRQVATARRELRRLSVLAEELLDLSRLDAQVPLRSEPVELGELARAVAAEFELSARERGLHIEAVPPGGPCWGRGDPDAVARVVRILLDNALRYGPPGEAVRVLVDSDERRATLEVVDRGPGIPPAEHEHIFERFHRGAAAGSEGGFGLGLAIGRELARRMGGDLVLADSYGRGARFVLSLRAAAPSPAASPARDSVAAG
jgi:signal transduction histidine kinase